MTAPISTPSTAWRISKNCVWMTYDEMTRWAVKVRASAIAPPSTPFVKPSIRNGLRMKPSVAPTIRMMEISRARDSTVIRIVAPMMITDTAAKASPRAIPATVATLRRR